MAAVSFFVDSMTKSLLLVVAVTATAHSAGLDGAGHCGAILSCCGEAIRYEWSKQQAATDAVAAVAAVSMQIGAPTEDNHHGRVSFFFLPREKKKSFGEKILPTARGVTPQQSIILRIPNQHVFCLAGAPRRWKITFV